MIYLIFLLVFGCVFYLTLRIASAPNFERPKLRSMPQLTGVSPRKNSLLLRFLNLFTPLNRRLLLAKIGERFKNKLVTAGSSLSVGQFLALKQVCALLAFILVLVAARLKFDPRVLIFSAIVGFFLPDLWINSRIKKRRQQVLRQLPSVIDLLGLTVGAGLDLTSAIDLVVKKSKSSPLIEELFNISQESRMGKTRREALRTMANRLNIPEVSSLVRTLVQADRMGTGIDEALRIHSEESRLVRFERGERLALQAPLKLLIPLIFCILPVVFIIVAGPIILEFTQLGNVF